MCSTLFVVLPYLFFSFVIQEYNEELFEKKSFVKLQIKNK